MKWKNLPNWIRGGITGAVLFLVIWNILFLIAYLFELSMLWDLLFYLTYPIMPPVVGMMNILFGVCYTASRCFSRLPAIFILMTLLEGFIIGAVVQCCKNLAIKLSRPRNARYSD